MSKKPLFSIVTVVFNNVENIEKTIESVLSQDFSDYEYIVIDGGSTDGTVDVVNKYADKITTVVSEKDKGIYDAMNKGTSLAKGEWVNFMNSGDVFSDNSVLSMVSEAALSGKYDIIYGDIFVGDKENNLHIRKACPEAKSIHRMFFCHQSAFIRTKVMKSFGYDISHRMSADLKFFKECYNAGCRFFYTGEPHANFDLKGISNTQRVKGLRDNVKVVRETDKGLKKVKHLAKLYYAIWYLSIINIFRNKKR